MVLLNKKFFFALFNSSGSALTNEFCRIQKQREKTPLICG